MKIEDIIKIIINSDKILFGIGANVYSNKILPKNNIEWSEVKKYIKTPKKNFNINETLINIIKNKDYFIITTSCNSNLDEYMPKEKLFTPFGNCSKLQCYNSCTTELWDFNLFKMKRNQPKCPHCGSELIMNITTDAFFVDKEYKLEESTYYNWINKNYDENILLIEWEIGNDGKRLIKDPFENIATALPNATLLRINSENLEIPTNIKNSLNISITPRRFINALKRSMLSDFQ